MLILILHTALSKLFLATGLLGLVGWLLLCPLTEKTKKQVTVKTSNVTITDDP
jgi:hypothetical protein